MVKTLWLMLLWLVKLRLACWMKLRLLNLRLLKLRLLKLWLLKLRLLKLRLLKLRLWMLSTLDQGFLGACLNITLYKTHQKSFFVERLSKWTQVLRVWSQAASVSLSWQPIGIMDPKPCFQGCLISLFGHVSKTLQTPGNQGPQLVRRESWWTQSAAMQSWDSSVSHEGSVKHKMQKVTLTLT